MKGYDYERFIARVSEKIDGKVMASGLYAPAFESKDFVQLWFNIDRPYRDCPPFGRKVRELGIEYIIADDLFRTYIRKSCGPQYEQDALRYLNLHCKPVDWVPEKYPSYWASGNMISEMYVFKTPPGLMSLYN